MIALLAAVDVVNIFVGPKSRGVVLGTGALLVEVLEMLIGLAALLYMLLTLRSASPAARMSPARAIRHNPD